MPEAWSALLGAGWKVEQTLSGKRGGSEELRRKIMHVEMRMGAEEIEVVGVKKWT